MGDSIASVARRAQTIARQTSEVDFALIGHQESWRTAADVLAVLRGPEHPPLPDDEISKGAWPLHRLLRSSRPSGSRLRA